MHLVKIMICSLVLVATCFAQYQHIYWRTTRGASWQTTGGACKLETSRIIATVHQYYVDIEEEATILTQGTLNWGDDQTLEIYGQFKLSQGTAVRSMLLWNGNQILKAKLKDRAAADSAYESVVNRVVVRDPAIIASMGNDWYSFKIFPVAINQSRKIRILYTIPLKAYDQSPAFDIKPAFVYGASAVPSTIPIEIRQGSDAFYDYKLQTNTSTIPLEFNAVYQIASSTFVESWDYSVYPYVYRSGHVFLSAVNVTWQHAYGKTVTSGTGAGYYNAVFTGLPASLAATMAQTDSSVTIQAKIKAGTKSFITEVPYQGCIGIYYKSAEPWDQKVYWSLFSKTGTVLVRDTQAIVSFTTADSNAMLPLIWGAKYSLDQNMGSLGGLYGFVDARMSLLALEQDSLCAATATHYVLEGVPALLPNEIVIDPAKIPAAPAENIMFEFNTGIKAAFAQAVKNLKISVLPDGKIQLTFASAVQGRVDCVVYDLSGRMVYQVKNLAATGSILNMSLPRAVRGCFIMKIRVGGETVERKIVVR